MKTTDRRGAALLAVLWLSAALSAIAFTLATTVRAETQRTATAADGLRAYYLATGAAERALLYMTYGAGARNPDNTARYWENGVNYLRFTFPAGEALVEIVPETAKLNINNCRAEELFRLLLVLGARPDRAQQITAAIVDWRTLMAPGTMSPYDQFYLAQSSSFRARHASLEETEELLLVHGMTPEIYYGTYERGPQGNLVPHPGLKECVSVYGSTGGFDVNTAHPALLQAVGLTPETITAIQQRRRIRPFRGAQELGPLMQAAGAAGQRLRVGGNSIFTLRATARLRVADGKLSDLVRSVGVTVQMHFTGSFQEPYDVLRWYENAPVAEGLGR
ncbi:MAG: type II secretion system protein GspK [Acidobacteria bacterium]|nr:type II secretion system protein GspK [Acidobacteriota bacterium]